MTLTPLSREQQLEQLIDSAPKEMSPSHDLWQGIEKRMDKPLMSQTRQSQHGRQWAIAASFILLVALGYTQLPSFNPLTTQQTELAQNSAMPEQQGDAALQLLLTQIAASHQAQVDNLEQTTNALAWQTSSFSAPVEQGLAELRRAATQIYQALQANPTDKQLWQLWLWVQQRELDLLQQGQKLPIRNSTQGNTL
ncbi:anti-sigma factor [Shewanella baltica]|uniref:anti-sigma factor n=1 Tax=Shewanella TaxID=22 RepID=UPI00217D22DE|nr:MULTISPECIES: anti-sigma factor [Shewanella]MCS6127315.1 anti-sigma factor [Shewanella baltica]MCS6139388.1 anti-sigma factor [Shewanella baltica]MCS6145531.1 anti-sigma factor [Shewanella baltica]MCS6170058.1 anti-sigma factor [Shewanella baltica]MCS6187285.1 anti-sigma factor [Shewanella baltica]